MASTAAPWAGSTPIMARASSTWRSARSGSSTASCNSARRRHHLGLGAGGRVDGDRAPGSSAPPGGERVAGRLVRDHPPPGVTAANGDRAMARGSPTASARVAVLGHRVVLLEHRGRTGCACPCAPSPRLALGSFAPRAGRGGSGPGADWYRNARPPTRPGDDRAGAQRPGLWCPFRTTRPGASWSAPGPAVPASRGAWCGPCGPARLGCGAGARRPSASPRRSAGAERHPGDPGAAGGPARRGARRGHPAPAGAGIGRLRLGSRRERPLAGVRAAGASGCASATGCRSAPISRPRCWRKARGRGHAGLRLRPGSCSTGWKPRPDAAAALHQAAAAAVT